MQGIETCDICTQSIDRSSYFGTLRISPKSIEKRTSAKKSVSELPLCEAPPYVFISYSF